MSRATCSRPDCDRQLDRRNRSGLCKSHRMERLNSNPVFAAANRDRLRLGPYHRSERLVAALDDQARLVRERAIQGGVPSYAALVIARDDMVIRARRKSSGS